MANIRKPMLVVPLVGAALLSGCATYAPRPSSYSYFAVTPTSPYPATRRARSGRCRSPRRASRPGHRPLRPKRPFRHSHLASMRPVARCREARAGAWSRSPTAAPVGVEPATMAAATPMATHAPPAITARPSVDRSGSGSVAIISRDIISTAAMAVVISVEGTAADTAVAMVAGITDPEYPHQGVTSRK